MLSHWKRAGAALILLAGVACALAACASANIKPNATTPLPTFSPATTPTSTPIIIVITATTSGRDAVAPPCADSQLRLKGDVGGAAMGHTLTRYQFINVSNLACSLQGFPNARMLDSAGRTLSINVQQVTTSYLWSNIQIRKIELAPGYSAFFAIQTDNVTTSGYQCVTAATTTIYPPGNKSGLASPVRLTTCDGTIYLSPVVSNESNL
jgi:uncharacterized protein DUF4232